MTRLLQLVVSLSVALGFLTLSIVIANAQNGPSVLIAEGKQDAGQVPLPGKTVVKGVPFEIVIAQAVKAEAKPKDAVKKATKAKTVVKAAPAGVVFAAPAAANLDPLIQQFSQQLRPILRGVPLVGAVQAVERSADAACPRRRGTRSRNRQEVRRASAEPRMVIINNRGPLLPTRKDDSGRDRQLRQGPSLSGRLDSEKELEKRNAIEETSRSGTWWRSSTRNSF